MERLGFRKADSEFFSAVCKRCVTGGYRPYQGRRLILALRAPISRSNRGKGQLLLIIFNRFSVRHQFLVRKWQR